MIRGYACNGGTIAELGPRSKPSLARVGSAKALLYYSRGSDRGARELGRHVLRDHPCIRIATQADEF